MKSSKLIVKIILAVGLILSDIPVFSQGKFEIAGGIGIPELCNIGIRYEVFDQVIIGLSYGFGEYTTDQLRSLSGDFYYHFGGLSKFSNMHPWYGRIGINYFRAGETVKDDYWDSYLRIGREFYFVRNFGISLDAGLDYVLYARIAAREHEKYNHWLPAVGVNLFIRF